MTTVDSSGYAPEWLRLREPADAEARAADLVDLIPRKTPMVIRDLGCGTGSLGRWLSGRLPTPQRWILHDLDPRLLEIAARSLPHPTTVEAVDITRLTDLGDTTLVTASALLDLLTANEIRRLVQSCADSRIPALFTLSVTGAVEITPPDKADAALSEAFNNHQRREDRLGPDAVAFTAQEFRSRGWTVHTRPSPWRLGADQQRLITTWYQGFVAAAKEQDPKIQVPNRRITSVIVHHADLLALP
ncbi:class I SAM-dependent methyltransferase [Amycolatopsis jejuensis]|uniref:class I SAM-dependent methyltransferase n=1 Tax=Amycolatopsis jejuensis TaxID=330084 RepID=UPI0005268320|nr:class I SAM-dependent methyltransferase [Amycolatopsis jejuensis]